MEKNKIYQGDCLEEMKKLPEKSVNMCMTSPPYWALRDYGDGNSQIWDGDENCEHEWKIEITKRPNSSGGQSSKKLKIKGQDNFQNFTDYHKRETTSDFCSKCGAWKGQLGLEPTFDLYIKHLCNIFDEVKRVLRDDGTCWVNLGDCYAGAMGKKSGWTDNKAVKNSVEKGVTLTNKTKIIHQLPQKCLVGIPLRFALEMINRGWILRNTIIWHKPNAMPSSVKDRFTVDFEYIFFFSKKKKYYFETQFEPLKTMENRPNGVVRNREYNYDSKENKNPSAYLKQDNVPSKNSNTYKGFNKRYIPPIQGRNKRTVWTINPKPFKEAHFAVYPEELCETPIRASCPEGGIVLDCFFGSGTTGLVALKQGKNFLGIELNEEYIKIAKKRLKPFLEQETLK